PGSSPYGYPYGSRPSDLAFVNGALFFSADDGQNGREPWILTLDPPGAAGAGGPFAALGQGSSSHTAADVREPDRSRGALDSATVFASDAAFRELGLDTSWLGGLYLGHRRTIFPFEPVDPSLGFASSSG